MWSSPACTKQWSIRAHDERCTAVTWHPAAKTAAPPADGDAAMCDGSVHLATASADSTARLWSSTGGLSRLCLWEGCCGLCLWEGCSGPSCLFLWEGCSGLCQYACVMGGGGMLPYPITVLLRADASWCRSSAVHSAWRQSVLHPGAGSAQHDMRTVSAAKVSVASAWSGTRDLCLVGACSERTPRRARVLFQPPWSIRCCTLLQASWFARSRDTQTGWCAWRVAMQDLSFCHSLLRCVGCREVGTEAGGTHRPPGTLGVPSHGTAPGECSA